MRQAKSIAVITVIIFGIFGNSVQAFGEEEAGTANDYTGLDAFAASVDQQQEIRKAKLSELLSLDLGVEYFHASGRTELSEDRRSALESYQYMLPEAAMAKCELFKNIESGLSHLVADLKPSGYCGKFWFETTEWERRIDEFQKVQRDTSNYSIENIENAESQGLVSLQTKEATAHGLEAVRILQASVRELDSAAYAYHRKRSNIVMRLAREPEGKGQLLELLNGDVENFRTQYKESKKKLLARLRTETIETAKIAKISEETLGNLVNLSGDQLYSNAMSQNEATEEFGYAGSELENVIRGLETEIADKQGLTLIDKSELYGLIPATEFGSMDDLLTIENGTEEILKNGFGAYLSKGSTVGSGIEAESKGLTLGDGSGESQTPSENEASEREELTQQQEALRLERERLAKLKQQQPEKKGMSGWAMAGIGVGALAAGYGLFKWGEKKGEKKAIEDFELAQADMLSYENGGLFGHGELSPQFLDDLEQPATNLAEGDFTNPIVEQVNLGMAKINDGLCFTGSNQTSAPIIANVNEIMPTPPTGSTETSTTTEDPATDPTTVATSSSSSSGPLCQSIPAESFPGGLNISGTLNDYTRICTGYKPGATALDGTQLIEGVTCNDLGFNINPQPGEAKPNIVLTDSTVICDANDKNCKKPFAAACTNESCPKFASYVGYVCDANHSNCKAFNRGTLTEVLAGQTLCRGNGTGCGYALPGGPAQAAAQPQSQSVASIE